MRTDSRRFPHFFLSRVQVARQILISGDRRLHEVSRFHLRTTPDLLAESGDLQSAHQGPPAFERDTCMLTQASMELH